jgi:asparagine synthase (glutamine-hydrolysing)
MCAILGAYNIGDDRFKNALNSMVHRGIDDTKILKFGGYSFGFNHLAIENLSNSSQPFLKDGILIVFNGEIYNYKKFAETEVETIFILYKKYGVEFVNMLDGMFAIAIYDKKLYLFRDIFGKKPLYFTKDGIFSSEIKGILSILGYKPKINLSALAEYLSLNSSIAPNTIYQNIYKLPAGCYFDGEIKKYYDFKREIIDISEEEAIEEIDRLLKNSISKRLQSRVEIGSLLSGGIDSSLIASLMPKGVKTFSIGYDGYENYDERKWAKLVAKNISSNHYEISMNKEQFFENIDKVLDLMEEPIGDSAYIPAFHLASQIPLKVVMSGEGSDELFLGYRRYEEFFEFQNSSLPNKMWLKKYLERHYEDIKEWEIFRRFFADEPIFRGINEVFYQTQIDKILKTKGKTKGKSSGMIDVDYKRFLPFGDSFDFTYFDIKIWLGEVLLMKLDKMFMGNSIEARSPFLDKELVEFVFSLPEEIRGRKKSLIKKVASRYIPNEIINRKKKGFAYPYLEWLKEENRFSYILTINQKTKLFNENYLKEIVKSGHKRYKQHIWSLYLFSRWIEKNML